MEKILWTTLWYMALCGNSQGRNMFPASRDLGQSLKPYLHLAVDQDAAELPFFLGVVVFSWRQGHDTTMWFMRN